MLGFAFTLGRRATAYAEKAALDSIESALNSSFAQSVVAAALRGPLVDAVAREAVRAHVVERAIEPFTAGDGMERAVAAAVDTPAARRLVAHVIESGVVDEAVTRLLESEELWVLVDEVARSPAVTEAISHQGAGLVDQMAGVVRDRSRSADARLERVARRLTRRTPAPLPNP